ncbi:MAG: InlB B-repeat-containing protein, partial [Anaerofustis sp.]
FTLTYTTDGNGTISGTTPQSVDYGTDGTEVTAVPNTGYHFTGWSDGVTTASRTDLEVTEDINVQAQFAIDTFTLTYTTDGNGTISGTTPQSVNYGTNGTEVTAVPNTGYHFTGWSDGVTTASRTDLEVTEDINVQAQFAINTYTVTWMNGTTQLEQDLNVPYGTTPTYNAATPSQSATAQYTYTFNGWSPVVNPVTGDVTYQAQFSANLNSYPVTFLNYNGVTLSTQSIPYGSGATAPVVPARVGYTFTGWNTAFNNITGPLTVTAQFVINSYPYTVNYVDTTGTVIATATGGTAVYGSTLSLTPIAIAGYTAQSASQNLTIATTGNTVTFVYDTAVPLAGPTTETLDENQTPLAGNSWALLNLLLAIGSLIIGAALVITYYKKKEEDEEIKRKGGWRLFSAVVAIAAVITFFVTEDLTAPMAFTDKWTILMAIYALVSVATMILSSKKKQKTQMS